MRIRKLLIITVFYSIVCVILYKRQICQLFMVTLTRNHSTTTTTIKTTTKPIYKMTRTLSLMNSKIIAVSKKNKKRVVIDEDVLTNSTLQQLKMILMCNEKDFNSMYSQRGEFWVLKNYVRAERGTVLCHETITYTTHASFEFLDNIGFLVQRWMGPISIAVHAPGSDFQRAVDTIRYLHNCLSHNLVKQYVTFHIFFHYKHIPAEIKDPSMFMSSQYNCKDDPPYKIKNETYAKSNNLLYPVNVARNIARDAALTHFVLAADVELYPRPVLIKRFLNMIARNGVPLSNHTSPKVFPIPIFEVREDVQVPASKSTLQALIAYQLAFVFHQSLCNTCHTIPLYNEWIDAPDSSLMDIFHVSKRQGNHVHWEPIFIGTNQDPYYDERLSWQGFYDKMTQGYILCLKDYDFMILNNAFLVHKPGIKKYKKDDRRQSIFNRQIALLKYQIVPELEKIYGKRDGCGL